MNIFKNKFVQNQDRKAKKIIYFAGIVSLIVYLLWFFLTPHRFLPFSSKMIEAARIMEKALFVIREYREKSGIEIDRILDPNGTGLIGPAYSPIVTTKGHLQAKRTTTNPEMAALIVFLLQKARVKKGDTIAIGCSASFPALMIAALSAAKAMAVNPVLIFSLGASSYGASDPGFNLLDMFLLLREKGVFPVQPAAMSLGGEGDAAGEWKPETKKKLLEQIRQSGIPFIYELDFRKNVHTRMDFYRKNAPDGKIAAFINCGGGEANIGLSSLVLKVKPGLNRSLPLPLEKERGVLFEMANRDVPCIHLLFIKGLVRQYGLPWDPVPLPRVSRQ
ncbi:MAG: poly-gamma-glutamate system protein [Candidatus Aminicenantes bacterium]|nr:poly-gamma-glutamate system protein [Candidatus Aminicenantes bacterium]